MRKKGNIEDLTDELVDVNDMNKKALKDKGDEAPKLTVKGALLIQRLNEKKRKSLIGTEDSVESKLLFLAKARKKENEEINKAKKREAKEKFKEAKKKAKKKNQINLRMMFADEDKKIVIDDENNDNDIKEINEEIEKKVKNPLVKDTSGTILDSVLGKRFAPIYNMQLEEFRYMDKIIADLKDDLAKSPSRNMYRSSQTSNLLSALSHKRTLMNDMVNMAKSITDLEIKKAKEDRAAAKENNDDNDSAAMAAKIGANIIKGVYDSEIDFVKKKKKKKKYDDDDDEDEDKKSKKMKDVKGILAARAAKNIILNKYERNIDIEGDYQVAVLADEENPKKDWKFILIDSEGHRMKDWEKERSELLPSKKKVKLKFMVEKLKVLDTITRKTYKLILK